MAAAGPGPKGQPLPLPTYQFGASYLHGGWCSERRGQRPVGEGHIGAVGQLLLPVKRPQNTEEVSEGLPEPFPLSAYRSWAWGPVC